MGALEEAKRVYGEAATVPQPGLCCVAARPLELPGLVVPEAMRAIYYGCGTKVHPAELGGSPRVLYVGVGGGLEALQFAYFSRRPGGVVAVDPVAARRAAAGRNLQAAAAQNDWFAIDFVHVCAGGALRCPQPTPVSTSWRRTASSTSSSPRTSPRRRASSCPGAA